MPIKMIVIAAIVSACLRKRAEKNEETLPIRINAGAIPAPNNAMVSPPFITLPVEAAFINIAYRIPHGKRGVINPNDSLLPMVFLFMNML